MKNEKTKGILIPKNKSIKLNLVKMIVKNFCLNNLFSSFEKMESQLQDELNLYLKFETKVFRIAQMPNGTSGQILVKDENNTEKSIDFTILSTGVKI